MNKFYFFVLFIFALISFRCSNIIPVLNDVCEVSSDICIIANNVCTQLPNFEICDVAGDVCNYANNICQLLPDQNLSDETKQNILNELKDIKNNLQEKSNKPLNKNDLLSVWQINKIRLFEIQNILTK